MVCQVDVCLVVLFFFNYLDKGIGALAGSAADLWPLTQDILSEKEESLIAFYQ